jgi:hypothetical protein
MAVRRRPRSIRSTVASLSQRVEDNAFHPNSRDKIFATGAGLLGLRAATELGRKRQATNSLTNLRLVSLSVF